MTLQTPLIYNPATQRIDELPVGDQLAANIIAGLYGRNRFINGDLRFWQRRASGRVGAGSGTLGNEAFAADRWSFSCLNCTHDVLRGVQGSSATTLRPQTTYAIVHTVSGANSSSAAWAGQRIEDVRSLQGQVTFSCYVNGTAGLKVGVRAIQNFGTGGSPSADVSTDLGVITLASNPTKISLTVTLPSTAGKTLGTANNSYLYVVYDMCGAGYGGQISAQNGYFAFSDFQIEEGPVATVFEYRPDALELALCQRYYEKSFPLSMAPAQNAGIDGLQYFTQIVAASGRQYGISVPFLVRKRTAPTITLYNPSAANNQPRNTTQGADCYNASPTGYEQNFLLNINAATTSSVGQACGFHWTADAEI